MEKAMTELKRTPEEVNGMTEELPDDISPNL